jgi:hypothetical protein
MISNDFDPDTDIPSLAGKVIFITGGKRDTPQAVLVIH